MYGVLVCPRCGTAQGADLSHARMSCVRCQAKIDISRAKVHFSTDSPQELADAVRRLAERRRGQEIPFPSPVADGSGGVDPEAAIEALGREKGEFTEQDIARALGLTGDAAEAMVRRLLAAGLMYETAPGTYRAA